MPIFLNTVALYFVAMIIHVIVWKARLPKRHLHALLVIFAAVFLLWLAYWLLHRASFVPLLHVALYYWSVCLSYTITYTAIEADSPTLSLMRFIGGASEGRSTAEIAAFMAARPFMGARLIALVKSGLIHEQDNRYLIAGSQPLAFRLILGFRKLYGSIPKGG